MSQRKPNVRTQLRRGESSNEDMLNDTLMGIYLRLEDVEVASLPAGANTYITNQITNNITNSTNIAEGWDEIRTVGSTSSGATPVIVDSWNMADNSIETLWANMQGISDSAPTMQFVQRGIISLFKRDGALSVLNSTASLWNVVTTGATISFGVDGATGIKVTCTGDVGMGWRWRGWIRRMVATQ